MWPTKEQQLPDDVISCKGGKNGLFIAMDFFFLIGETCKDQLKSYHGIQMRNHITGVRVQNTENEKRAHGEAR